MLTRQFRTLVALAVVSLLIAPRGAFAQDDGRGSLLGNAIKATVLDPTTYAPAILSYDATTRDWKTSQPFFQNGFVERNARFTMSGHPNDIAVSYAAGRNQILKDSLGIFAVSAVHNFGTRLIEQSLRERYPDHRKLVTAIGWVERIAVASAMSYKLSGPHYRQWQENKRLMIEFGIR